MSRRGQLGRLVAPALAAGVAAFALLGTGMSTDVTLERVSLTSTGAEGALDSLAPALSDTGRFVAFLSDAPLVPGDTNARDVYVYDRIIGTLELVSVATDGTQANGAILYFDISGDGRYVAFATEAANLVALDENTASDVFLHDRMTGITERVSITNGGGEAEDDSITPSVSGDGRYVTFTSRASNLVEGDENGTWDVFLRDRVAGTTELISVATDGTHSDLSSGYLGAGRGRVSSDGRYVAFGSFATNLVPDDLNAVDDAFVRDRVAGTTVRVSVSSEGVEGADHATYPDVSDDGRYAVFDTRSPLAEGDENNNSDIYLRDLVAGTTTAVSRTPEGATGFGPSQFAEISGDGSTVAFESAAADLVSGDANLWRDVFAYDVASGAVTLVSVGPGGVQGDESSSSVAIDADGDVIAFHSVAENLVDGDGNERTDVFVSGKSITMPTPGVTVSGTPTDTPTPTPSPTPLPCDSRGDVNDDGTTNSLDALFILQYVAGLLASLPNADLADVNGDGSVTSIDALLVLQFVAGVVACLPP